MFRKFAVVWGAATPIGTPIEKLGDCVTCGTEICNLQNHYMERDKGTRICLYCVSALSQSYEGIFNHKGPREERKETE